MGLEEGREGDVGEAWVGGGEAVREEVEMVEEEGREEEAEGRGGEEEKEVVEGERGGEEGWVEVVEGLAGEEGWVGAEGDWGGKETVEGEGMGWEEEAGEMAEGWETVVTVEVRGVEGELGGLKETVAEGEGLGDLVVKEVLAEWVAD